MISKKHGESIIGYKGLVKVLTDEMPKAAKRADNSAANAAGTVFQKAVKSNAPIDTGTTSQAIGKRVRRYSGASVSIVGARKDVSSTSGVVTRGKNKGKPRKRWPFKYTHLVEGGHGGKTHAEPHPFVYPAYVKSRDRATAAAAEKYTESIVKASLKR